VSGEDIHAEHELPDLKELERRIEQLAQELEKVSQMAEGIRSGTASGSLKLASPSNVCVARRPTPPKDQISFFACNPPYFLFAALTTYRLVGV
jgi:hypothetical protein